VRYFATETGKGGFMQRVQGEETDPRFTEGLAKLGELRALHRDLSARQSESHVIANKEKASDRSPAIPNDASLETELLRKGRARALEEFYDHEIKAHAFSILAGRYKTLGMETQADAYSERAQLESATTKGFHAVIEAYDNKLNAAGIAPSSIKESKNLNLAWRSLDSAENFLEGVKADYALCCEHTDKALKAVETIKKLEADMASRSLAPDERKLMGEASMQRDTFLRMAERKALDAATSYRYFQAQLQSAEKICESCNRTISGKHLPEQTSLHPAPAVTEQRMNGLTAGMVISQALKALDHEL
jgi:hypothetical protein